MDTYETIQVALEANELVWQTVDRVFKVTRVHSQANRDNLSENCLQYMACEQMKKRILRNETIDAMEDACPPELTKFQENNWPSLPPAFTPKWTYGTGISWILKKNCRRPSTVTIFTIL